MKTATLKEVQDFAVLNNWLLLRPFSDSKDRDSVSMYLSPAGNIVSINLFDRGKTFEIISGTYVGVNSTLYTEGQK